MNILYEFDDVAYCSQIDNVILDCDDIPQLDDDGPGDADVSIVDGSDKYIQRSLKKVRYVANQIHLLLTRKKGHIRVQRCIHNKIGHNYAIEILFVCCREVRYLNEEQITFLVMTHEDYLREIFTGKVRVMVLHVAFPSLKYALFVIIEKKAQY